MIELKIMLNTQGQVSVEGPLENKLACLGLIELAKDAIKNYDPRKIQVVPAANVGKL